MRWQDMCRPPPHCSIAKVCPSLFTIPKPSDCIQRNQSGTATVELALLLPLLVTLCAFITEFGRLYWTQNVLQKAAQEGARALSLAPPNQLGQRMPGITAQMLQDIRSGGLANVQSANIALVCLDLAFNPFAAPPAYCTPGSTVAVDAKLGYVQTNISLPLPNLGSWLPFYFPLPAGAGFTIIDADSGYRITLNTSALYRYASN